MCDLCGPNRSAAVVDHGISHPFELKPETDNLCTHCEGHLSVHPDKMEYLAKKQMDDIIRVGHEVIGVFSAEPGGPNFAYSMGRTVRERPELLVTGKLPLEQLQMIINTAAAWDAEHPLEPGDLPPETMMGCAMRIVEVPDLEAAEMNGVLANFGTLEPRALQVIWPDAQGYFPGDPDFAYGDDAQPVFA